MELAPGLTATVHLTVTAQDTAIAVRSGDVAVLATPRVVALVEEATVAAVAPALDAGLTTVGTSVELEHLAPSLVGAAVQALARLVTVDGRRLGFEVSVVQLPTGDLGVPGREAGAEAVVARGRVERVVVDRERFLARAGGTP